MCIRHVICEEFSVRYLSVHARHFQAPSILAREIATQGGEVDYEADSFAYSEVEVRCLILPEGDRDRREPSVEWFRGIGMLGKKRLYLGMNGRFPLCVDRDIEENPAGWLGR
jgi:hypothetical protein